MPTVHLTLTDMPNSSVQVDSDYTPARGEPCSLAQQAALEIIQRTRKAYGRDLPACPGCGSSSQVWRNQITGALTCHRLSCHGSINPVSSL
jgi:hypothetical protein